PARDGHFTDDAGTATHDGRVHDGRAPGSPQGLAATGADTAPASSHPHAHPEGDTTP
ncbi:MAG: hypothetical protein HOV83_36120, partial [Catenulispora sp.]|nr:hypothetical protein [Catenulispora sp.]